MINSSQHLLQKEVKEQKKNLILNKNIDVKTLEDEKDSITFSF